jgi:hypothetical protein
MKYYFITYQATNRQGSVSIWNQVISEAWNRCEDNEGEKKNT